jgi:hypothetical protein
MQQPSDQVWTAAHKLGIEPAKVKSVEFSNSSSIRVDAYEVKFENGTSMIYTQHYAVNQDQEELVDENLELEIPGVSDISEIYNPEQIEELFEAIAIKYIEPTPNQDDII